MRYSSIREQDISNGDGIGVSLFTQGCPYHCKNCFNQETWSFDGGKEYNIETQYQILELIERPYIKRFSILGGEPLINQNKDDLIMLCSLIKEKRPDIKIWCYTGSTYEKVKDEFKSLFQYIDILVDGPYIDELRDLRLKYRGSSNQRVIDIQKTILEERIVEFI